MCDVNNTIDTQDEDNYLVEPTNEPSMDSCIVSHLASEQGIIVKFQLARPQVIFSIFIMKTINKSRLEK